MNFLKTTQSEFQQQTGTATWIASYRSAQTDIKLELHLLDSPDHPALSQLTKTESASGIVIFDGVLYNRTELNHYFTDLSTSAASDAELVLQAYQRWGEDVLHKLKGIFALMIWDSASNILLCARDPLGVYPMFYANAGRELLVSTSIEALTKHPRVSAPVNRLVLTDFLCNCWLSDVEETFFGKVKRVPPGHVVRIDSSSKHIRRYWDLPLPGEGLEWLREEEIELFDKLLEQAVERCLEFGPAAIYLSGGLDSVSVAAVATASSHRKGLPTPWAMSLGFPDEGNEEEIQRGVAKDLGLPQVLMPLEEAVGSEGVLLSALKMSSKQPVPQLSIWKPAYRQLALEAKQRGCKVILTGDGGDEWLGVTPFLAADLIRTLDIDGIYQLWSSLQRSYSVPWYRMMHNILWRCGTRPLLSAAAANVLLRVAPGMLRERRRRPILQKIQDWVAPDPLLQQEIDRLLEQYLEKKLLKQETGGFYFRDMREVFDHPLITMDREEVFESGTHTGLRLFMPYWDADLLEMLYRTPPHLLSRGGRSKGLVRQSLARRFPNLGFEQQKKLLISNFFNSMIVREGGKAWQILGGTPALAELGVVDAKRLNLMVEKILAGNQPRYAYQLWNILTVEAWLQPRLGMLGINTV